MLRARSVMEVELHKAPIQRRVQNVTAQVLYCGLIARCLG